MDGASIDIFSLMLNFAGGILVDPFLKIGERPDKLVQLIIQGMSAGVMYSLIALGVIEYPGGLENQHKPKGDQRIHNSRQKPIDDNFKKEDGAVGDIDKRDDKYVF